MKMTELLLCISLSYASLAQSKDIPQIIDFKKHTIRNPKYYEVNVSKHAPQAFNRAFEVGAFFSYLKDKYRIDTVIETGSYEGSTSLFFAQLFSEVHTLELSRENYRKSKELLQDYPNVTCHLGNSSELLNAILPTVEDKGLIFYLDAHWNAYWPLQDELEAISKTHRDNCIIVINDIKVPGYDQVAYDSYNSQECSYEYVKPFLDTIFSDYTTHYLIPDQESRRAKLVVIPKFWKEQTLARSTQSSKPTIQLIADHVVNPEAFNALLIKNNINAHVVTTDLSQYRIDPLEDTDQKDERVSKIMFWNIPHDLVEKSELYNLPKEKMVLFMWEPPTVIKKMYSEEVLNCFSKVYTWDDELVDNIKFFKFYYPVLQPQISDPISFKEKKLCTFISSNAESSYPREIYSERKRVIEYFEQKPGSDFEFFGRYWDPKLYKNYKGTIDDKTATMKKYKFAICYENTRDIQGYVTEKIFDCFQAGTVPIYYGASNIVEYVPKSCFIDRRDFDSLDKLYDYIKNMKESEYEAYQKNIRIFLKSDKAALFSRDHFNRIFMQSITDD